MEQTFNNRLTVSPDSIKLEPSWKPLLLGEFEKPYMKELKSFLTQELKAKKTLYPKGNEIFQALNLTPFDQVKVVILGQDPYHGPGQAHGLCFSVRRGVPPPPSLENIFKELDSDLGIKRPPNGDLICWARQGVLLLNAVLTVELGRAASHQGRGWETFTDRIIDLLNNKKEHLVFLLWGNFAQKKGAFINRQKHLVLESVHPSPLSANRGFFGCKHFSKTNEYLIKTDQSPIDWDLNKTATASD